MLRTLSISKVATYQSDAQLLNDLKAVNFIYGCNGSGKTTISRVIRNPDRYDDCTVEWEPSTALETYVFNKDFIESNFNPSSDLKGVFTLGEDKIDIIDKIKEKKDELKQISNATYQLQYQLRSLDGTTGREIELQNLEETFKKKCWEQKKKHEAKLKEAMRGFLNDQQRFKEKILVENDKGLRALLPLEQLENKVATLFGEKPVKHRLVPDLDTEAIKRHATNPILAKRIIGREDVDIAAMIRNSGTVIGFERVVASMK